MTLPTASTQTIYQLLMTRIMSYVPAGGVMAATPLSATLGGRAWILAAPDNAPMPFVTIRMINRVSDGSAHGLYENFTLEVNVFNRPRTLASVTAVAQIADQIQAALTDFKEPTGPMAIRAMRLRSSFNVQTTPADRDVVRELMQFDGFMMAAYLTSEVGSS